MNSEARHVPGQTPEEFLERPRHGPDGEAYYRQTALFAVRRLRAENAGLAVMLESVIAGERCKFDVLNPCWDLRPSDVPGKHWGVGNACPICTARAALAKAQRGGA